MADMTPPTPRANRKRRLSADEVRNRMLAAAQAIVLDLGMTVSLEDVSLEDVMRRAEVPRSSVYRLWPYRGDFIDDLLCHMAQPDWVELTPAGQQSALDVAREVARANEGLLGTAEGRRAVSREASRLAVLQNLRDLLGAKGWTFYFALASTVDYVRDPHARARIAAALEQAEVARIRGLAGFYREVAEAFGLRPRTGYRFEHLALAGGAMLQGLMLRMVVSRNTGTEPAPPAEGAWTLDSLINDPLPGPGLDTPVAEWSFAAGAYLALFESILEPDPDFVPGDPAAR